MLETVQNHRICLTTYPRKFSLQAFACSWATITEIKKGKLLGYVQYMFEVPDNLRSNFENFRPLFKTTLVSKIDFGDPMKNYAKEERLLFQPGNCWHPASHYEMVHWLLLCCCLHKNKTIGWVHLKQKLQQLCAGSSGRKNARSRKSKFKRCHRNKEDSSQQLLRLPDNGPEPTHCNEVPQWRKNLLGYL